MEKNIDEDIKTLEELINNCEECKFATCEQCEINWTKVQAIKNVLNEVKEYIKSKNIFNEVVSTIASSTITCHCGKGTLGILYINDGGEK